MRVTFGWSTQDKAFANAIRWFTGDPASHSYLRYEDPWGNEVVLEAVFPVVMERPAHLVLPKYKIVEEIHLDIPQDDLQLARNKLGHWYDQGNIAMFVGWFILDWLGAKKTSWKSHPGQFICSDIQLCALRSQGLERTEPWEVKDIIDRLTIEGRKQIWTGSTPPTLESLGATPPEAL